MRILLVDDHELFREGLKYLLRGLEVEIQLDEAATCAQALERARQCTYDLVLLDLKMPDGSGMQALEALRAAHEETPLVVLSGEDHPAIVREAIDCGAMGFIPKSSKREVLIQALRLVLAGGVYLPPAVLDSGTKASEPEAPKAHRPAAAALDLTPRQMEVLRWLIQGKPNKVIARELGVADSTVKTHVTAVLQALGVTNRTEAVYAAAKLDLPRV